MSEEKYVGGCLCGALRFVAKGKPDRVGLCHCTMCRKHTGAPFVQLAIFPSAVVSFEGETYGYRSSAQVDRRGCAKCGAPVYIVSERHSLIELYVGAMDDPKPFAPQYEIFTVHRPEWLPAIEGVPTHERSRT